MWMDEQTGEIKDRMSRLSDEELLDIVEVEFNDYRKEALEFARQELTRRGIRFEEPETGREENTDQAACASVNTSWAETCARCGGKTRQGVLLENKEITLFLTDRDEHRFLEVYACRKCGYVQLAADFDTDVE
jgi:hypothetical protein